MFEVKRISDNVFQIICDGFDAHLLNTTIPENNKNVIDFCTSIVKSAIKGFVALMYIDTQG